MLVLHFKINLKLIESLFFALARHQNYFHKRKMLYPFHDDANKASFILYEDSECFPLECDDINLWESKWVV